MANTKVVVSLSDEETYDVRVGSNLLDGLGRASRNICSSEKALVLTDKTVGKLYLDRVRVSLATAGYQVTEVCIPPGEESKTVACASEIWEAMAQTGFARDSVVFALGGGVVGDIAGFVASTFMRGLAVIQVPTSLLAMVDSSVGGKTAVNLKAGKNLVGTFKQPLAVYASLDTLATLPEDDWSCGCAEIAKSAMIDSDDFFFWLTGSAPALSARDETAVIEAITRSVVFKANIVAADITESKGVRECLNYGHTLGHAIEMLAGYGTFSHGAAVAEGMRFAARLGAELKGTSAEVVYAQDELLDSLGLPSLEWKEDPQTILDAMHKDKKVRKGSLRFVLFRDVGDWEVVEVEDAKVLEHLEAWADSKGL